jgi:integrase
MPTKKLDARVVANAKAPKSGRLELWDTLLPAFGLRVTDKDARTFCVMYRAPEDGRQRRLKIGDARVMSLGEAREAARDALRKVAYGVDPAEERRPSAVKVSSVGNVRAVASAYLERYVRKNTRSGTFKETKRTFDVDVLPAWGARPIGSITRRDAGELLDVIAARGAEVQANRTLTRIKTFFRWAVDEEVIPASPVTRMKPLVRETSRDRALSDDEIRFFWSACGELGWPFGPLFQLLLVTAQRRDEVGTMTFGELDLRQRLWVIPREKAKNDRAHEVALSDRALATLCEVKETRGRIAELKDSPFVFTTNGRTSVSGFSRAKINLDAKMERLARRARGLPEEDDAYRKALKLKAGQGLPRLVPDFIVHDLRRTAATGMARLNIPPHVVDKVLNHSSGAIRGVAAVYNRFEYLNERRAALEAWGRYVDSLLVPHSNVVELRA